MDTSELLSADQAASHLGIKPSTLQKYRIVGGGPKFVKVGRLVKYRACHLDAWLDSRTFGDNAEARAAGAL